MPARPSSKLLPVSAYQLTAEDTKRFAEEAAAGMVLPDAPVLTKRAAAVAKEDISSKEIQAFVAKLFAAASSQQHGNQKDKRKRTLVGLAAPQLGVPLRIIVVDTKIKPDRKKLGVLECFINPQIVWSTRQTEEGREGCFSAGPVWGLVRRPIAIKLRALTPEGKSIERVFEGFTARILQHECDHLEGIRFADRIMDDRKRHWVHTEEIHAYAKDTQNWPRICTRERWEAFKQGRMGLV